MLLVQATIFLKIYGLVYDLLVVLCSPGFVVNVQSPSFLVRFIVQVSSEQLLTKAEVNILGFSPTLR